MRRSIQLLALAAVLSCVAFSYAGVRRDDVADDKYLELATHYPSVGKFDVTDGTNDWVGSGTLVASQWVLTAAHMTDGMTSMEFAINGKTYTADCWKNYPKWTGDLGPGYDIALVHLRTAVTGVTPAVRYKKSKIDGLVGTAVGFGTTGTGSTGATDFDEKERATQNVIEKQSLPICNKSRVFMEDFDDPTNPLASQLGGFTALPLEGIINYGDSGGGVFVETPTGPQLVGVNSFVFNEDGEPDGMYGNISGHTRVSAYNKWIDSTMKSYAKALQAHKTGKLSGFAVAMSYPVDGPQPVPEPAGLALLLAGAIGILRRRRGR